MYSSMRPRGPSERIRAPLPMMWSSPPGSSLSSATDLVAVRLSPAAVGEPVAGVLVGPPGPCIDAD